MTVYTYTTDLPAVDPKENKRQFYKLPKSMLLPPYLLVNPYFLDYASAIDTVFDYTIEARSDALAQIRNMWVSTKRLEEKVRDGDMLDFNDWGGPERAVVVQQVNLLGMKLANAGVVSESAFRALAKFLGSYWFGKGKESAVDFLNFCLGSGLSITKLVTQDYIHFYPETSETVGAYVYEDPPGPWYPTTHVQISMPTTYKVDPITLGSFFYEICNYNLVLYAIAQTLDMRIVSWDSETLAKIVALAGFSNLMLEGSTPTYPLLYHSRVGGWTGGVNQTLMKLDTTIWP